MICSIDKMDSQIFTDLTNAHLNLTCTHISYVISRYKLLVYSYNFDYSRFTVIRNILSLSKDSTSR
jgi:hypothetical protein